MRTKDKDNENIIAKLNKKAKELEEELQHLKQVNSNHYSLYVSYHFLYEHLTVAYETFEMI